MKKAQMEILGLAIVVLLLSFGMLLVFQFFVLKEPGESIQKVYTESQQTNNMLTSILRTSSGCKKTTLEELFEDCMTDTYISCNDKFDNDLDLLSSCAYVDKSMEKIFEHTLDTWKKKYFFSLLIDTSTKNWGTKCTGEAEVAEIPTPTASGKTMFIRLEICS